ncbi:MAG: hypothetical protein MZU97_26060 [Bacillus subtilis]|nr:hypothetical protein [Bacillus subtilis]
MANFGYVESQTNRRFPKTWKSSELVKVIDLMNELLVDTPISQVSEKLHYEIQRHIDQRIAKVPRYDRRFVHRSVLEVRANQVLLDRPIEHALPTRIQRRPQNSGEFIDTIESNDIFKLIETSHEGITVKIGTENTVTSMKDVTVVSAQYDAHDGEHGTISIVGPTRMEYRKVIPMIRYLAKHISKLYEDK